LSCFTAFDPGKALADIAAHRVTAMFGVPAMFQFMAHHPTFDQTDLSSVRVLIVGGAPCPLAVLKAYLARGVKMQQGYGLTETAPMVSFLAPEFALTKVGSSGKTPIFVDMKHVDAAGRLVTAPGAQGEVLVRGPNVTSGYWKMPEATRAAIDADGWFRTGDAAYLDGEGFLFICDRVKDMIITGGENVYPAEVESGLMHHLAIAEVAVIGEPDETWGRGDRGDRRLEERTDLDDRGIARVRGGVPRALQAATPHGDGRGTSAQCDRQDIEVSIAAEIRALSRRRGRRLAASEQGFVGLAAGIWSPYRAHCGIVTLAKNRRPAGREVEESEMAI